MEIVQIEYFLQLFLHFLALLNRIAKVIEIMQIEDFLQFFLHFSAKFSNAISSEVPWLIDFKFYVRHPGRVPTKVMEILLMQQFCQQSVKAHGPLVQLNFLKILGRFISHFM